MPPLKVLLVEDDDAIRELYALKFELAGFDTAVAENGRLALAKLSEFKPHFVLLDLMMPVMDGTEFLERLGARIHQLEIIIFSNAANLKQRALARQLGVKDFWVKSDYTPERVAEELARRWLDR